ncbi:Flp pilus assembly protein TadG [Methylorubrum salsuginis]|uniref:Flp pilus assembly protein TadG n=1 Tax=Methylorubrum salsuginis TaxID=414703 RepID=A0A1I4B6X1_9HYPH|nr:Flp pilus assembly protein TadG [Methylorubrum salsuginis]
MIVAVMMVPLMGIVGGAVDFGHAVAERTRLNTALDAAALVAARAAQDADAAGKSDTDVRTTAEKAGADYFNAMKNLPKDAAGRVEVKIADRVATISASYSASMPTTMLGVLGYKTLPISSNATSSVNLSPLVDIHLLIDVSGSMAIGATDADVTKLRNKFNCAFACHDGKSFTETTGTGRNQRTVTYADTFDWAQKNGVNLRINEINKGITDFVNDLIKQSASSKRLRISVHSFSNDLSQIVALTSTLDTAKTSLPKTPSASSETEGGTHFSDIMPSFADIVGKPGDGTLKPRKLVIIATDGVQDPNRLWSHSGYEWMRPLVRPFDPADCRKLDSNVTVGVLYAPYINMPWDWGFNDTLGKPSQIGGPGTRFDDIVPQLKACASSPSMFINTATTASIGDAFKAIYNTYKTVRLSQ